MSRIKIRSMIDNFKFNHNITSLPKNIHFEITNLAKSQSNKNQHALQIDDIRTCYQFTIEALEDEQLTFQTKTSREKNKQRKDLLALRQIRRQRKSQDFEKSYFTLNSSKNKGCSENLEELGIQKKTIGNRSLRIGQAKKLKFIEEKITPTKTKRDKSLTNQQNRGKTDSFTFYKQMKDRSSNQKFKHLANTYNFKLPKKEKKVCLPPAYSPRRLVKKKQSSTLCPWQNENSFYNFLGNQ